MYKYIHLAHHFSEKAKKMSPNPPLIKSKCFLLLVTFLSLYALYLTSTYLHNSSPKHPPPQLNIKLSQNHSINVMKLPSWYKFLANEFKPRKMRIGLLDVKLHGDLYDDKNVNLVDVEFERVSDQITWDDLFPGWIDEDNTLRSHKCPTIPLPDLTKYTELDVVVAKAPCGANMRDVYRLQVNLVVANLAVRMGGDPNRAVYIVFIGKCGPMFEFFHCDDMLWDQEEVRVYKPNMNKLKQKLGMPVGSCQLARPLVAEEILRNASWATNKREHEPRQAYVTVLHSSETYVCGAIILAQSIIQSKSTKDLILLADSSISQKSLEGLRDAGWKITPIQRIRSPHAAKDAYNEWNYSKLRIWEQLVEYDKVIFVDSDVVLIKNMDEFFSYPQLSAATNDDHFFNSGVMVVEPSACTFKALMEKRHEVVPYNGGDQGFLNEFFVWWHRLPMKVNRLKVFSNNSSRLHRLPDDVYAIHYLGLKPWMCYQDYDCNWDRLEYQKFASNSAHDKWWQVYSKMPNTLKSFCALSPEMDARIRKWRGKAKNGSFPNGHWMVNVRDPRRHSID